MTCDDVRWLEIVVACCGNVAATPSPSPTAGLLQGDGLLAVHSAADSEAGAQDLLHELRLG